MLTRQAQRQTTIRRVLGAAAQAFDSRGFAQSTIRDIATAAGLSTGSVMSVGDKDALLVYVMDDRIRGIHRERAAQTNCPKAASEIGCAASVVELLDPFVELFTREPQQARAYAGILVSGRHSSAVFTELADTLTEELAAVLVEHGSVPERARGIYLAYLGLLFTWPVQHDAQPAELRASLSQVVAALVDDRASAE